MTVYWSSPIATLYQVDARALPLLDASIHCVVTSPPYWGLRDYGLDSEGIGLESTLEEYVANLVLAFREVRRVLRDDGVMWLNIGDGYGANYRGGGERTASDKQRSNKGSQPFMGRNGSSDGQKLGIPERVILALQSDGWLWRDTVVWAKPSPMPESVAGWRWERCRVKVGHRGRGMEGQRVETYPDRPQQDHDGRDFKPDVSWEDCPGCPKCTANDGLVLRKGSWRCTRSHEYVYMLVKGMHYYCDGEAVRVNLGQANRRSVWRDIVPEHSDSGNGHYATFPSDLPRLCIQASTSEAGCCPTCSACWARIVEGASSTMNIRVRDAVKKRTEAKWGETAPATAQEIRTYGAEASGTRSTVGWRPTCSCPPREAVPCVVLDPFCGTGTTLVAAQRLGRRSVGVDLKGEYLTLAVDRLMGEPLPLAMNRYEVAKSQVSTEESECKPHRARVPRSMCEPRCQENNRRPG